jgi:hypothetical protein
VAGCCEYGDEPSGSGATELVKQYLKWLINFKVVFPEFLHDLSCCCRL